MNFEFPAILSSLLCCSEDKRARGISKYFSSHSLPFVSIPIYTLPQTLF